MISARRSFPLDAAYRQTVRTALYGPPRFRPNSNGQFIFFRGSSRSFSAEAPPPSGLRARLGARLDRMINRRKRPYILFLSFFCLQKKIYYYIFFLFFTQKDICITVLPFFGGKFSSYFEFFLFPFHFHILSYSISSFFPSILFPSFFP
jgi:hypothetical protein